MSQSQVGELQADLQALAILQVVAGKAGPQEEATLSGSNRMEHFANRGGLSVGLVRTEVRGSG